MLDWNIAFYSFLNHYLSIISLISFMIIIIVLRNYLQKITQPFDHVFVDYEPGYGPTPEKYVKHHLGFVPTIYPYGWSPILESRDLKKCQVLSVSLYDEDLVLYRDGSGEVHVFDAFCPHLGANIGIGGTVEGSDRLRCPFHGWTFNTDGQCVAVPGLDKNSLPKSSLKKWVSAEKSKFIWIWRHPEGRVPKWPCINVPNFDENTLTCLGRAEFNLMMNVQDFGENTFDFIHFDILHSDVEDLHNYPLLSRLRKLLRPLLRIKWDFSKCSISFPEFKTPFLLADLPRATTYLMGVELPTEITNVTIEITNPYSYFYRYEAPSTSILFHAILLPVSIGKVKVVEYYYTLDNSLVNWLTARLSLPFLSNLLIQQDSPIWQNRMYLAKPHLTKLDWGVTHWRRWMNKFNAKSKSIELSDESFDKISEDNK